MKRQEMVFDPFQLINKKDRKQLTRRNDRIGLTYLCGHFAAIGVSGTGIYLTSGTLFMLPMMLVHGILLACLFAPMHECSHGTAFRTRRLNEAVYWFVSLVYIIQPTWYRYRHAVHHTYTHIQGMDPAMVLPSPTTWRHYGEQLLGWRLWTTFPVVITKHAFGRMRPQDSWYVPKQDLAADLQRGPHHAGRVWRGCRLGGRVRQLCASRLLDHSSHHGGASSARLAHRRAQRL